MRPLPHMLITAIVGMATAAFAFNMPKASADTIAIIGTDSVAAALGPGFARLGHEVIYGSRDPDRDKVRELVERTGGNSAAMGQAQAAAGADIVVLAVPWDVVEAVVENLGDLSGKIIVDPTNPRSVAEDGLRWYPRELSNAEIIQQLAPGAHVVKAFNTLSAGTMADPATAGGPVSIPLAGNDTQAKQRISALVSGIGLEPVDVGPVRYARVIEGLYYLRSNARTFGQPFDYHFRRDTGSD